MGVMFTNLANELGPHLVNKLDIPMALGICGHPPSFKQTHLPETHSPSGFPSESGGACESHGTLKT